MNEGKTAKILTAVSIGYNSEIITVECNITRGLPAFNIVGLPDKAVAESKERVRAAITNSGFTFPAKHITINLAPANIRKDGSHFDLPIALSILAASGQILNTNFTQRLFAGELGLDGSLRAIPGSISLAEAAAQNNCKEIVLPEANAKQAAMINSISVVGATTLNRVFLHIVGENVIPPASNFVVKIPTRDATFDEIYGQETAKRGVLIALAGHHNLIMNGPPGSGKTMLAKSAIGLLPQMTPQEILETTKVHSLAGNGEEIISERPFRAPHSTASFAALIGGGNRITPGEISLAHNGVLFLDEIPEFSRKSLEALRQPLEDQTVSISRANNKITYPADFMLIATMNPCPCGFFGDETRECTCSQTQILNYQKKISGPLLDRIDLKINVAKVPKSKLIEFANSEKRAKNHSVAEDFRERIEKARKIQLERQGKNNARLTNTELKKFAKIDQAGQQLIDGAIDSLGLSARSYFRVLKVARTIADLHEKKEVEATDIAEALQYR